VGILVNYLPRLTSNCDLLDLSLPSREDYSPEPLGPSPFAGYIVQGHFMGGTAYPVPTDGRLDHFCFLPIMNNIAVNTVRSSLLGKYL
jgi:hypothetical protein